MASFDKVIPPGKEGKIAVKVKTQGYKNTLTRSIAVETNDPAQQKIALKVKMNIKRAVLIEPQERLTWNARVNASETKSFFISSENDPEFAVTAVQGRRQDVKTTFIKVADDKCKNAPCYEVKATFSPDKVSNRYNERLTIKTTSKREPETFITLSGRIDGNIIYNPTRLNLQSDDSLNNGLASASVNLTTTADPFVITAVSTDDLRLKTVLHPLEEHQSYVLTVIWDGGGMLETNVNSAVTISTNDSTQQQISIPVAIHKRVVN